MEDRITVLGALRWCRDSFASWFTTAWLYIILWGVIALAFAVLLYIDATFSRKLAPESINPLSFQGMGVAYRLFAAAFLMAAARCVLKGLKGAWTFRLLGAFASVIVCLHAFGFGFEALDERRDQALAVRDVAAVVETNNQDAIGLIDDRIAEIDAELALAIPVLNAEIRQYITDGLNNDDLADDARNRRNALQDAASAEKRDLRAKKLELLNSAAVTRTEAIESTTEVQPWAPLFVGIAQLFTWSKEPTDWEIYLCAIGFVVFWVLLGESLVIFLPERVYAMHLRDAALADERRGKDKHSELTKDGIHRKKMQDKIDELEEEIGTLRKARHGPDRIVQGGSGLDPNQETYWREAVAQMLAAREKRPKLTLNYLAEKYGGGRTAEEMTGHLQRAARQGWITREEFDRIMQLPKPNGADVDTNLDEGDEDADATRHA